MNKGIIFIIIMLLIGGGVIFYLCKQSGSYSDAYSKETIESQQSLENLATSPLPGYASKFAVIGKDEEINAASFQDNTYAAIMVNNDTGEAVVAHNVHRRIYPASMTKLMTGMVVCDAIKKGEIALDDVITIPRDITFRDTDAVSSYLHPGDRISVRNMLYALMLSSYNDYCIYLAEAISGSEEGFVERMNQKAAEIGATCTHFMNPHGLDDLEHYTTAYDMYLIVNAASEYEIIHDIDSYTTYTYSYTDSYGNVMEDTAEATNQFLVGEASLPSNITIRTWKTGTTGGAGNCLTMRVRINGTDYTMMVADSISHSDLYHCYSIMFNMAE
ncbi:MAG: D-alanyl-D-alanine carboxypeptidase [Eubacterium sp.]|nr:D-alanyl-D-alanine carboxypeptidase [Eubacterium sp.]